VRVVFDTNIFVSTLVLPGSQAEAALLRIIEGQDELVLSKAIIDELLQVLARKFERNAEELARVALLLADLGGLVYPRRRLRVFEDEPDNRVLECALTGKASVIVTGDKAMLRLGEYGEIAIMSLKDYLSN
jgi:putative PIN family toxin of toxin-antitoxin system